MTTEDVPSGGGNDSQDIGYEGEGASVGSGTPEHEPSTEDIMSMVAREVLKAGEAHDMASLAVWTGMSGPLPPPWILEEYDRTISDGANRIMAMAERSQAATIADQEAQRRTERLSQFFAFICVLAILGTGITLMVVGQVLAGLLLSSPGLAAVVYAFVRSRG